LKASVDTVFAGPTVFGHLSSFPILAMVLFSPFNLGNHENLATKRYDLIQKHRQGMLAGI